MTRIRAIKPEFWSSPDTGGVADPWTRLLYIAMWNWADDAGRGVANPKELAGFAFPHDEHIDSTRVRCMLAEVSRGFSTVLYKVGNRTYYAIPAWDEHQKIDRKSRSRHPAPEDGEKWRPCGCDQGKHESLGEPSPHPRRALDEPSTSPQALEQGNRGTGETESLRDSGASAPREEINPGTIVGAWTDAVQANGSAKISGNLKAQVGREAREQLDAGTDPCLVLEAARQVGAKGFATLNREVVALQASRARKVRPIRPAWMPPGYDDDGLLRDPKSGRLIER